MTKLSTTHSAVCLLAGSMTPGVVSKDVADIEVSLCYCFPLVMVSPTHPSHTARFDAPMVTSFNIYIKRKSIHGCMQTMPLKVIFEICQCNL